MGCFQGVMATALQIACSSAAGWGQRVCAPRHEGAGRLWGQARPDSQVEDCSSGLPDFVPSPAAPSPATSLPGLVLGVTI